MGRHHLRTTECPEVYTDGENTVIVLDGSARPRSVPSQRPIAKDEKLRFSVNRNGGFTFSKKSVVTPKFEAQPKLDGDGEKIPNAEYARQKERWGYSHEPEFEMENILLEEPTVRLGYDVDRHWWGSNAYTYVTFGDGRSRRRR
jgi:hypothetical protein